MEKKNDKAPDIPDHMLGKGMTMVLVDDNDVHSRIIAERLRGIFNLQVLRDNTQDGPKKFRERLAKWSENHDVRLICFDRETYWENGHTGHHLRHSAQHDVPHDAADTFKVGRDLVKGLYEECPKLKDAEILSISDHNPDHGSMSHDSRMFTRERAIADLQAGAGETVDYIRRALQRAHGIGRPRSLASASGGMIIDKPEAPYWAKHAGIVPTETAGHLEKVRGKVKPPSWDRSGD